NAAGRKPAVEPRGDPAIPAARFGPGASCIHTRDRRNGSGVPTVRMNLTALVDTHPDPPGRPLERLPPSLFPTPSPSHRDASPFLPAGCGTALDALCG